MFTKEFVDILNDASSYATSAVFKYPKMPLLNKERSIITILNLDRLGIDEFDTFGIYYLGTFLNIVKFIGDSCDYEFSEVFIDDKGILIIKGGNIEQYYATTNIDLIPQYNIDPYRVINKIETNTRLVDLEINGDMIKEIIGAVTKGGHEHVIFDFDENYIIATTRDDDGSMVNPTKIKYEFDGMINFDEFDGKADITLNAKNFMRLEKQDYKMIVAKGQNGSKATLFSSKDGVFETILSVLNY